MTKDQILIKIRSVLKESADVQQPVELTTSLVREGITDSMQFFNYLIQLEEVFGLAISEEDVTRHNLEVIGNMVSYLESRAV